MLPFTLLPHILFILNSNDVSSATHIHVPRFIPPQNPCRRYHVYRPAYLYPPMPYPGPLSSSSSSRTEIKALRVPYSKYHISSHRTGDVPKHVLAWDEQPRWNYNRRHFIRKLILSGCIYVQTWKEIQKDNASVKLWDHFQKNRATRQI